MTKPRISFVFIFVSLFSMTAIAQPSSEERVARKAPDWVNKGTVYQISLRAFTPEGTLPAAEKKLPELARLGVTIIYLWPVTVADDEADRSTWSPRHLMSKLTDPRNPYRVKDYYNIDPEYGTDADLKRFVNKAHDLGMKVILDIVFAHCGPNAVFLKEHPDFIKRDKNGEPVASKWRTLLLDFDNPALREYLLDNMVYFVKDFGVDGYRVDVSNVVPLDFWEEGRRRMEKVKPELAMLAESSKPENQLFAYDMNYWKPVWTVFRNVMDGYRPALNLATIKQNEADRQLKGARTVNYIDNHDIANDDYTNRREHRWGKDGNEAALALCFTLDGVPMLYNGQEIADKSRHSLYGNLHIDWSKADTPEAKDRFTFCQRMIQLRKDHPALQSTGKIEFVDSDRPDSIMSFERSSDDEKILVVVNIHNEPVTVAVRSDFAPADLLYGKGKIVKNEKNPVFELPAYGFCIGKVKP